MKKKLFILVNTLSFFVSHRLEIAIAAKDKGYDVKIGYGELGNIKTSILSKKGIDCFKLPLYRKGVNPFLELWSLFYMWQIFYKLKPDIVHLITIKPYLYGGIAARLAKIPVVVSTVAGLGILFNQKNLKNFFLKKFLYLFFYLAFSHPNQKIIVQNKEDKKKLINWIGISRKKFSLFRGSGVDLSKFKIIKKSNNSITVCFASRLLYHKGIFDYINAAREIQRKGTRVKFLIAGVIDDGNPTSVTLKELSKIKKEKIVKFIGYKKNIHSLLAKCDIVCLPSYYGEGLPKILIEAAAAGKAIVTTNIPGCRDAIINKKTGLLVKPKSPKRLANALLKLIINSKERVKMGKEGRKLAEKYFSIKEIIKSHLDLYEELYFNSKIKN